MAPQRKKELRISSWTMGALFIGIIVLVNGLIWNFPLRLDFTEEKLYTLSSSTKKVLSGLDDIVTVKVYFSKKLPPDLLVVRDEVSDILNEYKAYARGKLRVKFIDPQKDQKTEAQVVRLGIPPVQMNILEKDKLEVAKGYLGVAFFYQDKKEVIPIVQDVSNLEYEITSRILKLTSDTQKTLGFVFSGKHSLDDDYRLVNQEIQKEYRVSTFKPGDDIKNVDLLVVVDDDTLSRTALEKIEDYLETGNPAIFLVDGVYIDETLRGNTSQTKLIKMLKHYGIQVNKDLILDVSSEIAPFQRGFMRFFVQYPLWVKVQRNGFNKGLPPVSRLESLVLPWTSSITVDTTVSDSLHPVVFQTIMTTTKNAWRQVSFFTLDPQSIRRPKKEELKQYTLGVLARGSFRRFTGDTTKYMPQNIIVVIGNTRFLTEVFAGSYPENLTFFMNLVDYLGLGEDLIAIRSKGVTDRPLKQLSEFKKTLFKFTNIYALPILIALIGVVVYIQRRREEKT